MSRKKNVLHCLYCGHRFTRDEGRLNNKFKLSCPECTDTRHKEIKTFSSYPKDTFKEVEKEEDPVLDMEHYYTYY